jgi:hypothetical protein
MKKSSQEMVNEWEKKQELNSTPRLILNRIKTPDGTILTSYNRHDYVSYEDANGLEYMVDGGLEYLRRNVNNEAPHEELSITDEASFEQIRESLHWGTYGKKRDQPLKYVTLCEMSNNHLQAIIGQKMGGDWVRSYMKEELDYRKENNISIKD